MHLRISRNSITRTPDKTMKRFKVGDSRFRGERVVFVGTDQSINPLTANSAILERRTEEQRRKKLTKVYCS